MVQSAPKEISCDLVLRQRELQPAPPRHGRWVQLESVEPCHAEFLYLLATSEENALRWRFAGGIPTREMFVKQLWTGVLTRFVVFERRSGTPIGHVLAYSADIQNRVAFVGAASIPEVQRSGVVIEGVYLFLRYLFATYSFRKSVLRDSGI